MSIMKPVVNLNGTSAEELIRQNVEFLDALAEAEQAAQRTAPHARDYPGDTNSFLEATKVHASRVERIAKLREEVMEETLKIQEQADPSSSFSP